MMKKYSSWLLIFGLVLVGVLVFAARGSLKTFPDIDNTQPWGLPYNSPFLPIAPRSDQQLCSLDPSQNMSWEQASGEVPVSSGIGYGVAAGDVEDAAAVGTHVFAVKSSRAVTIHFHVLYTRTAANTAPLPLRWYLILDEQPLPFMENTRTAPYRDIELAPGDDITLNVTIPPLSQGIHDLIFLGFATGNSEDGFSGDAAFYDYRITLLAGEHPRFLPRPYQEFPVTAKQSPEDSAPNLMLSLDGSLRYWNEPQKALAVKPGETVAYQAILGFAEAHRDNDANIPQPGKQTFALLAFLDDQPVDLLSSNRVVYGVMPRNQKYTQIAAKIIPPVTPGRHDLLMVRINYPGFPMCLLRSPAGELRLYDFLDVFRAPMEVVESQ